MYLNCTYTLFLDILTGNLDYHAMYITVLRVYVLVQKGSVANEGGLRHIHNGLVDRENEVEGSEEEDDFISNELNTAV